MQGTKSEDDPLEHWVQQQHADPGARVVDIGEWRDFEGSSYIYFHVQTSDGAIFRHIGEMKKGSLVGVLKYLQFQDHMTRKFGEKRAIKFSWLLRSDVEDENDDAEKDEEGD